MDSVEPYLVEISWFKTIDKLTEVVEIFEMPSDVSTCCISYSDISTLKINPSRTSQDSGFTEGSPKKETRITIQERHNYIPTSSTSSSNESLRAYKMSQSPCVKKTSQIDYYPVVKLRKLDDFELMLFKRKILKLDYFIKKNCPCRTSTKKACDTNQNSSI